MHFTYLFNMCFICVYAAATAKSLQSCPTLCNPIDSSPPGSPVPGILQARVLEWGAIAFSNVYASCVQYFVTLWIVTCQGHLYIGLSRQEILE